MGTGPRTNVEEAEVEVTGDETENLGDREGGGTSSSSSSSVLSMLLRLCFFFLFLLLVVLPCELLGCWPS